MNYTPGPWKYSKPLNVTGIFCASLKQVSSEHSIAMMCMDDKHFPGDQATANAQLISAAPDMYEALSNIENDDNRIPQSIWSMRNKALAKAEGKSE